VVGLTVELGIGFGVLLPVLDGAKVGRTVCPSSGRTPFPVGEDVLGRFVGLRVVGLTVGIGIGLGVLLPLLAGAKVGRTLSPSSGRSPFPVGEDVLGRFVGLRVVGLTVGLGIGFGVLLPVLDGAKVGRTLSPSSGKAPFPVGEDVLGRFVGLRVVGLTVGLGIGFGVLLPLLAGAKVGRPTVPSPGMARLTVGEDVLGRLVGLRVAGLFVGQGIGLGVLLPLLAGAKVGRKVSPSSGRAPSPVGEAVLRRFVGLGVFGLTVGLGVGLGVLLPLLAGAKVGRTLSPSSGRALIFVGEDVLGCFVRLRVVGLMVGLRIGLGVLLPLLNGAKVGRTVSPSSGRTPFPVGEDVLGCFVGLRVVGLTVGLGIGLGVLLSLPDGAKVGRTVSPSSGRTPFSVGEDVPGRFVGSRVVGIMVGLGIGLRVLLPLLAGAKVGRPTVTSLGMARLTVGEDVLGRFVGLRVVGLTVGPGIGLRVLLPLMDGAKVGRTVSSSSGKAPFPVGEDVLGRSVGLRVFGLTVGLVIGLGVLLSLLDGAKVGRTLSPSCGRAPLSVGEDVLGCFVGLRVVGLSVGQGIDSGVLLPLLDGAKVGTTVSPSSGRTPFPVGEDVLGRFVGLRVVGLMVGLEIGLGVLFPLLDGAKVGRTVSPSSGRTPFPVGEDVLGRLVGLRVVRLTVGLGIGLGVLLPLLAGAKVGRTLSPSSGRTPFPVGEDVLGRFVGLRVVGLTVGLGIGLGVLLPLLDGAKVGRTLSPSSGRAPFPVGEDVLGRFVGFRVVGLTVGLGIGLGVLLPLLAGAKVGRTLSPSSGRTPFPVGEDVLGRLVRLRVVGLTVGLGIGLGVLLPLLAGAKVGRTLCPSSGRTPFPVGEDVLGSFVGLRVVGLTVGLGIGL
jgi:hypothetical protein